MKVFADRSEAGKILGEALSENGREADLVLAIPRGGLPVGRAVADVLGLPLDVVAAKKMGAPQNEELAVGAAASDGSVWLNESVIRELGLSDDHLREERERAVEVAREKERKYRGDSIGEEVVGKTAVVVDDGVATGATAIACARRVKAKGAESVVLAVPVGAEESLSRLEDEADEVVCLRIPEPFHAVGQFYDEFGQVTDEEAMEYLGEESEV